ncbi:hypothetical protein QO010_000736 [Caulobacter ginsengisoli]|uniref:Uncharacterized protein n=1 Tax=Caulobacter ginsengisoli TaxID=400775 RepID=A0ABU0IP86_9CAUL|nr:hypothetical protein [Caulobacter ginsengisoli]MDQ0462988.1 hypothetical protein [Caulobacter ginsengisoli]
MTLEERRAIARTMYTGEQIGGTLSFFVGLALLFWRRFGAPDFAFPVAWAAMTLGWALFAYVFVRRARFVRSEPTDPKA